MAQTKTARMLGLFVAAALTVSGCSSQQGYDDDCYDGDNDGYCDDGGGSGSSSSTYVNSGGRKVYHSNSTGISSGSSGSHSSGYKGGIGSFGSSSSG